MEVCVIWSTPATHYPSDRDGFFVESKRAGGKYFISRHAAIEVKRLDGPEKARLTRWLVDQRLLGVECPEVLRVQVEESVNRRPHSPSIRADFLLDYLDRNTINLGDKTQFFTRDPINSIAHETDMLLAFSECAIAQELRILVDYCEENKWISQVQSHGIQFLREIALLPRGYARIEEARAKNQRSDQAFVAMWFDESMRNAYVDGIQPAIQKAGYRAIRIDNKEHNNKIDDEIISEIRRSRFVVADFTQGESGARGGVYYEAGFAHGIGIPVIFTCRSDAINIVHFDTRQFNHIVWSDSLDLASRLYLRIGATIGDGPLLKAKMS